MIDRQEYGVRIGRFWFRYPYYEPRDNWIGWYVQKRYWEMGILHAGVYICIVPRIVLYVRWEVKDGRSV